MPIDLPRTEAGLTQRRQSALATMRSAERLAYGHAALAALAYIGLATSRGNWYAPLNYLAMAVFIAPLGWAIGRRQSAAGAIVLVALVLGLTIWQIAIGGRTPAVLIVAIIAWRYGQAFNAAREYSALEGMQFEPSVQIPTRR